MDIISPMRDFMFKRMFSLSKNATMLQNFLETYIDFKGQDLSHIQLLDKEIKRYPNDKSNTLDLRAFAGGSEIDVEVQARNLAGNKSRFCVYLSKMFSDQAYSDVPYDKMHKCVSLLILNYTLPERESSNKFCHTVRMRYEDGCDFFSELEFDVVELPKMREVALEQGLSDQVIWAKLLAAKSEEELDMINSVTQNPSIRQAVLTIKELSASEEMRLEETARLKAELDEKARLRTAELEGLAKGEAKGRAEGKAEGRAEGIAEERARFIANLRAMGIPEEQIRLAASNQVPAEDEENTEEGNEDEFEP